MDCNIDPTKPGCITFDPGVISTINWRSTGLQVSSFSILPRGELISEPSNIPNGSSTLPISEGSCKKLTHTQDWWIIIPQGGSIGCLNPTLQLSIYINHRPCPMGRVCIQTSQVQQLFTSLQNKGSTNWVRVPM